MQSCTDPCFPLVLTLPVMDNKIRKPVVLLSIFNGSLKKCLSFCFEMAPCLF